MARHPTLRQRIKDELLARILSGELKSGDRLIEMRIAAEFGTSQAPVREALRELEALGFAEARPHRGTVVRACAESLREVHLVRGVLEEAAIRLATRSFAGDVGNLRRAIEDMRCAARCDDRPGVARHIAAFHQTIMKTAQNTLLLAIWTSLQVEDQLSPGPVAATPGAALPALASMVDIHERIAEAIQSGDGELAARLARQRCALPDGTPPAGAS